MPEEFTDRTIGGEDWRKWELFGAVFDTCVFRDCNMAEAVFTSAEFTGCRFESCNLKLVKLSKASLKSAVFIDCKLNGVDFSAANDFLFSAKFEKCVIDYASFNRKVMRKTEFKDCVLKEASFMGTDLTGSTFDGCDLNRALFDRANLSAVDFRLALNYSMDPEKNTLKKTRFSLQGITGLLGKYDIKVD